MTSVFEPNLDRTDPSDMSRSWGRLHSDPYFADVWPDGNHEYGIDPTSLTRITGAGMAVFRARVGGVAQQCADRDAIERARRQYLAVSLSTPDGVESTS